MKQTLVIGSTVVDIIISLPRLPGRGDDININPPIYRLGGCAYNVYKTLRLFESPAFLCSPVGSGIYGSMVREVLAKEGIKPFVDLDEENGCCYCLVEPDGERTFLSCHGAEYLFSRSWMKGLDFSQTDSVFICGIELEDPGGSEIASFVCDHPELALYFAPGPRITHIAPERMEKILSRRDGKGRGPFLHLNGNEALSFSGEKIIEAAAEFLSEKTRAPLVITLGAGGCYCYDRDSGKGRRVPGFPSSVVDTTGAGDAHCGALIACLKSGKTLEEACETANRIGAEVVSMRGAALDKKPSFV